VGSSMRMDVSRVAVSRQESAGSSLLELAFSPSLGLIGRVRHFVSDFYEESLGDPDATSRIAMASHELLENAITYASHRLAHIRIVVEREEGGGASVTIETRNRTFPANLDTVRATLDELALSDDAMDAYQALLERSFRRGAGSGLGLGRVYAEADMKLSYEITGDEITIRAQARLDAMGVQ
jgi:anti-sigma regulatory factor (Ser/Thr protein kinase)